MIYRKINALLQYRKFFYNFILYFQLLTITSWLISINQSTFGIVLGGIIWTLKFVPWVSSKRVSLPRVPLMSSADSSISAMVSLSFSLHIILSTRLFWPMILSLRFLCCKACSFFNLRISTRFPILEKNLHYHMSCPPFCEKKIGITTCHVHHFVFKSADVLPEMRWCCKLCKL